MDSPNLLEKLRELIAQEQKVNELLEAWYANPLYGTPDGGQSAECRLVNQMIAELGQAKIAFIQAPHYRLAEKIVEKEGSLIEQIKFREMVCLMARSNVSWRQEAYEPTLFRILPQLVGKVESLEKQVVQEKEERQKVENECMKKMEVLMAEVNSLKAELHQLKTEPELDEVKPTFFQKFRSLF